MYFGRRGQHVGNHGLVHLNTGSRHQLTWSHNRGHRSEKALVGAESTSASRHCSVGILVKATYEMTAVNRAAAFGPNSLSLNGLKILSTEMVIKVVIMP